MRPLLLAALVLTVAPTAAIATFALDAASRIGIAQALVLGVAALAATRLREPLLAIGVMIGVTGALVLLGILSIGTFYIPALLAWIALAGTEPHRPGRSTGRGTARGSSRAGALLPGIALGAVILAAALLLGQSSSPESGSGSSAPPAATTNSSR